MRIAHISFGNLRRRKMRSALLILSILLGIASSVFLYTTTRSMEKDVADKLDQYGSNILILPDSGESVSFGGVTVGTSQGKELDIALIPLMMTIKNSETLGTISPKLLADSEIRGQRALLVGVDFKQELQLKKWWKINGLDFGQLPDEEDILVGSEAGRLLNLAPADNVQIKGRNFRVRGVIQSTGSIENDQALFMDLTVLQQLESKPSAISLIEVAALCYTCPIEEVTQQLKEKLPGVRVSALQSTIQSRDDTVKRFSLFAQILAVILLLISGSVVAMSMISSVKERTRDIGVLRAIGFRKKHILQMLFIEISFISLIGGVMGFGLGMGLAVQFGPLVAGLTIAVSWQPVLVLYSLAAAFGISLLASIYPAWAAAKLDPVEALRYF